MHLYIEYFLIIKIINFISKPFQLNVLKQNAENVPTDNS